METTLFYVIVFSLAGGLLSLIGGLVLLAGNKKSVSTYGRLSVPFAAGALLGAVFLDLLKEGVEESDGQTVLFYALAGIVLFFILERVTHWFHHHHEEDVSSHSHKSPLMIVLADTLHNALDGVAIGAAFLVSVPTGIITALAVVAHELPQEIGDFGLLISRGLSKKRVIVINVLSSLATTLMAVLVYNLGGEDALPIGAFLGLSAGFLLYIAASDLIPTIHQKRSTKGKLDIDVMLLLTGIFVVWSAIELTHKFIH